ncbi:hypothetical protein BJV77DRAFT_967097 [Russula vinacea]|nr:hypothetical protein BJV77DRAFT_967097 [Russula vinacea]
MTVSLHVNPIKHTILDHVYINDVWCGDLRVTGDVDMQTAAGRQFEGIAVLSIAMSQSSSPGSATHVWGSIANMLRGLHVWRVVFHSVIIWLPPQGPEEAEQPWTDFGLDFSVSFGSMNGLEMGSLALTSAVWIGGGAKTVGGFKGAHGLKNMSSD